MLQVQYLGSVKIESVDYNTLIKNLKQACRNIRKKYPDTIKILLFGSFAKGDYTPASDIDILIIVTNIEIPFLERRDLFTDFFSEIPFDVNMLVYTEYEIDKMQKENNLFIRQVLKEGRQL